MNLCSCGSGEEVLSEGKCVSCWLAAGQAAARTAAAISSSGAMVRALRNARRQALAQTVLEALLPVAAGGGVPDASQVVDAAFDIANRFCDRCEQMERELRGSTAGGGLPD